MSLSRISNPLLLVLLLCVIFIGGYVLHLLWLPESSPDPAATVSRANDSSTPFNKTVVGDQAQKNLGLTSKPLQATVFWKTVAVPGMVVDRPGISHREIVAPAVGTISRLWRVPGDTVRAGDILFTLTLASETLHQTQADLFKTSEDIKLAQAKRERLASAGDAITPARIIEVESDIKRLEVAAKAFREELRRRGFSSEDIAGIENGNLVTSLAIAAPNPPADVVSSDASLVISSSSNTAEKHLAFEVQALKVQLGEQVQAGQTLCHLSSHQWLAIEGRAFRDETTMLEQSVQQGWPVDVDFQEDAGGNWPAIKQNFTIHYLANTIDPITRTFAFLVPLENQFKTVEHADGPQILWRYRPGQKVLLRIRIEKLDNVFVIPADALVMEGADAFVFTQNVNTFERKSVHVLYRDREHAVLANDGSLPTYKKDGEQRTLVAVARTAAAQLNRISKVGSTDVPKGYHIHADGSLHKNEDNAK